MQILEEIRNALFIDDARLLSNKFARLASEPLINKAQRVNERPKFGRLKFITVKRRQLFVSNFRSRVVHETPQQRWEGEQQRGTQHNNKKLPICKKDFLKESEEKVEGGKLDNFLILAASKQESKRKKQHFSWTSCFLIYFMALWRSIEMLKHGISWNMKLCLPFAMCRAKTACVRQCRKHLATLQIIFLTIKWN